MPKKREFTKKTQEFHDKIVKDFVLDPHHLAILQAVCSAMDRIEQARAAIAADGLTMNGKPHPAWSIERDSRTAMLRGLRQLGLDDSKDPDSPRSFKG